MLRNQIEKITGLNTGYDLPTLVEEVANRPHLETRCPPTPLPIERLRCIEKGTRQLFDGGLRGGGFFGRDVWITSTHFPWINSVANPSPYRVHKAVILVRNPFDILYSLPHLYLTASHNGAVDQTFLDSCREEFRQMIKLALPNWNYSYNWWLSQNIPTHIIRYEDILLDPLPTLRSLCEFLLDEADLHGSIIEQRIKDVIEGEKRAKCQTETVLTNEIGVQSNLKTTRIIYKPRSGGILKSFDFYDEDMKKEILRGARDLMAKFCYINNGSTSRKFFFEVLMLKYYL